MITLITGTKGSGKTKRLLERINAALASSQGHVICVEDGSKLSSDVNYRVRLVSANHFQIKGFEAFYGLLAGLCAGDHDITDILVDATLRIGSRDFDELGEFIKKVKELSDDADVHFVFTVSTDKENIPADARELCEVE